MMLGPTGSVYVSADWSDEFSLATRDLQTLKFSRNGQLLWQTRYDGEGHGHDFSADVALDAAGFVYALGTSRGAEGHDDIVLIKYSQYCLVDTAADSDTDLQDLARLLAHFGTLDGATLADGDLDADGDVEISDLAILLANFPCDRN